VERLAPQGRAQLKWPNDVFLNARKVSGILIEIPRSAPGRFVVGVGLNVNNSLENAPAEVQALAISLSDVSLQRFDLTDVLVECLKQIEQTLAMLVEGDPLLAQLWREYSLLVGREVRVVNPGGFVQGVCQTIAEDGALVLKTPQGEIPCYGGVVEWFD
jgi:BirA family biotin operon repressor/biotin-[acetyl-CoA-carboxylase] ligase